ncbi:MAG: hypothetical protein OXU64_05910 [Gemmatimonadota bacterium]|nr:hypothetical protein [Gemmatimonadota bacterium]
MSNGVKALRVLKFGSSVLVRPELYRRAAEEVRAEVASGCRVVAVVSAMGETTDRLLAAARAVTDAPDDALLAALLGTGEEASVALLAVALDATGVSVSAFTRTTVPVRTRGPLQDADPVDVDTDRILSVLESVEVVVFPGFVGVDAAGTPSLLGRGGSDLSALFLGHALGAAEIRLVKDVDGIFPGDPRRKAEAGPFAYLSWEGARRIAGSVVQEKALAFAARHGLGFRVAAPGGRGTWVGTIPETSRVSATRAG